MKPIIHMCLGGYSVVAVGRRLYYSRKWKFFTDFLMDFPKFVLRPEWGNREISKPPDQRHPLIQWYQDMCEFQAKQRPVEGGGYGAVPTGPMLAYLAFAYDLYLLAHHRALPSRLVKRLRNAETFQGARHEVLAAATCIVAGFEVEWEDERMAPAKIPEFFASSRKTGERIAVEAKSRHRPGVLGQPGPVEETPALGVAHLLRNAFQKVGHAPLVVFLDLNLPVPGRPFVNEAWFKDVVAEVEREGKTADGEDRFNMLVFVNCPYHYGRPDEPAPARLFFSVFSPRPLYPTNDPNVLTAIHQAVQALGRFPNDFPSRP
jgi:hypothetical protein